MQRTIAYEAITKFSVIGTNLCVLAANYFYDSMPLLNTLTALMAAQTFLMDETIVTETVKPLLEARLKRKNYTRFWGERNKEIVKSLTEEKRVFSSRYTCFRQDVVDWINKIIEANKVIIQ